MQCVVFIGGGISLHLTRLCNYYSPQEHESSMSAIMFVYVQMPFTSDKQAYIRLVIKCTNVEQQCPERGLLYRPSMWIVRQTRVFSKSVSIYIHTDMVYIYTHT